MPRDQDSPYHGLLVWLALQHFWRWASDKYLANPQELDVRLCLGLIHNPQGLKLGTLIVK